MRHDRWRRARRRWIWLFALIVAVHPAGCSTPPPVQTYFAEFVPFALDRPLWPERPSAIGLSNAGESLTDAKIEMPTDSVMDILVELKVGQQLVGSVDMSLIDLGRSTEIHAAIELLNETGDSRVLFSTTFAEEPGSPVNLQADLSEWAGELVQIRVRSWGNPNAIIRWHGLGLSAPTDEEPGASTFATRAGDGRLLRRTNGGESEHPDIVLIMLDAARADAFLGADQPPSTPHIDALASESTHFTTAWAPSSWTGQSVPAIFTGQYPDAVGAEVWGSRLSKETATLAELLAAKGYFTALWSQHTIYRRKRGLQRSFEALQLVPSAYEITDLLLLPDADFLFVEDRPTFAMIHLLPPHDPYEPPEPFRGRLSSWYRGDFEVNRNSLLQLPNNLPTDETVLEETIRYVRDRYWENVEFADHLVGRLVQTLKDADRYENTLIVILADHGEALFEHGHFLHRVRLYEESLRVPLFVKWPAYMSGFAHQVEQPVILLDLAPTLIEGLSVGGEQTPFHGRNLIPTAFDDFTYDRRLYAYTRGNGRADEAASPVYAYRSGRHKVLYSASLDILQLFDLQQDPGEEHDLAATDLLRAKYLAQQAMRQRGENLALLARSGPQQIEQLDPETIRALRALGYIQ